MQAASKSLKVVIADDHAVVRSGYRRLLEFEDDIEVVAEFGDGEATLRWLATHKADVVILDLSMPGQGGFSTLRSMRQRLPSLHVLIFTMYDSPALASQALEFGASGYITKNSPPDSLVTAVRDVVRGERPLSEDVAAAAKMKATAKQLPHLRLSPTEFEIFLLLAQGLDVHEIAARCSLAMRTAANYQSTIRKKTGFSSAVEMYRYAQLHQLLKMPPPH